MLQGGKEVEPSRVEGRLQSFEEQATEQAREHAHGQKEPRATGDPLASIGSDATAGYDAVQVGVKKQILAPSVQNGQESDFSSQMSRIGGNCLQGLRGSTEKDVIECGSVRWRSLRVAARAREFPCAEADTPGRSGERHPPLPGAEVPRIWRA